MISVLFCCINNGGSMKFKFLVLKNFSQKILLFLTFVLIVIIICIIKTSCDRKSLSNLPVPKAITDSNSIVEAGPVSTGEYTNLQQKQERRTTFTG